MRSSALGSCAAVLGLGWVLSCCGCGGGLDEGVPSDINPNQPSSQVKGMLQQGAEARRAAEQSRSRGKKTGAMSSPGDMPKKPTNQDGAR
jgi:hypothetical protein